MTDSNTSSWSTETFGQYLVNSKGEKKVTSTLSLEKKDLILLYFSASWCPPCQKFTPLLSSFYTECCVPNKVEIVFVSSDRDVDSFQKYHAKMPWLAMPIDGTYNLKQELATKMKVNGIPHLVVLDVSKGEPLFVSDSAKNEIFEIAGSRVKGDALIAEWKRTPSVPIDQATFSNDRSILSKVVWHFLKNPVYMIGAYYFIRKFLEYLQNLGEADDNGGSIENGAESDL